MSGNAKLRWFLLAPIHVKLFVAIIFTIFTFFVLVGIGIEMGVIPDTMVLSGKELAPYIRAKLVSNDIILESDNIIYFYSGGFLSVMEDGQLLTEDRVVAYETIENNQLNKYQMLYKNIKTIELVEQGDSLSDTVYKIIGNENASYEFITIALFLSLSKKEKSEVDIPFLEKILIKYGN